MALLGEWEAGPRTRILISGEASASPCIYVGLGLGSGQVSPFLNGRVTELIMSELCTQMGSFSLGIKVDHEPQVVLVVKNPPATAG